MSIKKSVIATVILSAIAGVAAAGEVPASFDPSKCKVDYPKASLMNEEQGTTSMSFLVNPDGSVADSKLDKSSGFKNLDKAAIKGLSACKFKPGSKDGAPAQTWTRVDYAWKLD
jgi:protein TonB